MAQAHRAVVTRSTTTRHTDAAVRGQYGRPTALTPTAVAVQSSMADIIRVAIVGNPIVGPPTNVAMETFVNEFLGRIRVAVGPLSMITGRVNVVME